MFEINVTTEILKWTVPVTGAVIAWLVNEHWKRSEVQREIKRQACLEALSIVDASFSNQDWSGTGETPESQPEPEVKAVRDVYNKLCISCDGSEVLVAYKKCLGVYGPYTAADIVDLRNAIRRELRYGTGLFSRRKFDTDRELAWIARINKPKPKGTPPN